MIKHTLFISKKNAVWIKIFVFSWSWIIFTPLAAQVPLPGKNIYTIRGQKQDIFYYPAAPDSKRINRKVLFAPGDGGWRGFAVEIAQAMAKWGYDVYGLDTNQYLSGFTGKTTLKETDVMTDFHQLAIWLRIQDGEKITLMGWSEGAGLCLLAGADPGNKSLFNGVLTLGLTQTNILGWRLVDYLTFISKKDPKEPKFQSVDYLPRLTPLPLFMIQSTHDEYISLDAGRSLFNSAKEPKRFVEVDSQNHHFDGGRKVFYQTLWIALEWILDPRHPAG